ncbi:DUF4097 domain-containing protein [Methanoplanus sp. FWC-SCC4]|uniref:DUF4097 domain-containing protein n=1 Tax=Methanochimaera problematica TaxID=2609417 RepID=A0AA97FBQ5_9EURY|nr:hypothetical protein [Methanoplanus sp. FWC-SCC4]WOF16014.1 DUF4097 domain-containing protein [Methanoplanus sp. FWC-SCC4]
MMKRIFFVSLFLAVFLAVAFSGCTDIAPEPEVTEQFDDEYEADDNTVLKVDNINGQISINGWEGDTITLNAIKSTLYGEDELKKVEITSIKSDNEITIKTKSLTVIPPRVSVDMDIKVPNNAVVDFVEISNGEIRISGTKGDTFASCSNGVVTMKNVNGYVKAHVVNGNINVEETKGIGNLEVSNGNIIVEIFDIKGDVNIKCINGKITAYIIPSLNADIEMKTMNGIISVENIAINFTKTEETHMEGVLGDGGSKILIENTNGNVNINSMLVNE